MAETTKIEWTDATFNCWVGCQRVATGCQNCYAESFAKRTGKAKWGSQGTRVKTSDEYWQQPLKWNRAAEKAGVRKRVFCASLADVFEDWDGPVLDHHGKRLAFDARQAIHDQFRPAGNRHRPYPTPTGSMLPPHDFEWSTLDDLRRDLFALIDATPWLDWLLLTKRPENIRRMTPEPPGLRPASLDLQSRRHNLWLGTSISDQETADRNVPLLLECRYLASFLFVSAEPLLGPVDLRSVRYSGIKVDALLGMYQSDVSGPQGGGGRAGVHPKLDWVIVGGESGPKARPMGPAWAESLRDQCQEAGVPFLFKQWGEYVVPRQMTPEVYVEVDKAVNLSGAMEQFYRVGKKAAGRLLDDREWNEFPEVRL